MPQASTGVLQPQTDHRSFFKRFQEVFKGRAWNDRQVRIVETPRQIPTGESRLPESHDTHSTQLRQIHTRKPLPISLERKAKKQSIHSPSSPPEHYPGGSVCLCTGDISQLKKQYNLSIDTLFCPVGGPLADGLKARRQLLARQPSLRDPEQPREFHPTYQDRFASSESCKLFEIQADSHLSGVKRLVFPVPPRPTTVKPELRYKPDDIHPVERLMHCYVTAIERAIKLGDRSIAMPVMGDFPRRGDPRFSEYIDSCCQIAIAAIRVCQEKYGAIPRVHFVSPVNATGRKLHRTLQHKLRVLELSEALQPKKVLKGLKLHHLQPLASLLRPEHKPARPEKIGDRLATKKEKNRAAAKEIDYFHKLIGQACEALASNQGRLLPFTRKVIARIKACENRLKNSSDEDLGLNPESRAALIDYLKSQRFRLVTCLRQRIGKSQLADMKKPFKQEVHHIKQQIKSKEAAYHYYRSEILPPPPETGFDLDSEEWSHCQQHLNQALEAIKKNQGQTFIQAMQAFRHRFEQMMTDHGKTAYGADDLLEALSIWAEDVKNNRQYRALLDKTFSARGSKQHQLFAAITVLRGQVINWTQEQGSCISLAHQFFVALMEKVYPPEASDKFIDGVFKDEKKVQKSAAYQTLMQCIKAQ